MWKKEDGKTSGVAEAPTAAAAAPAAPISNFAPAREAAAPAPQLSPRAAACISQGIRIKGEVTGSEDLFVDGHVDGKLSLTNGSLTIGPNGMVKADVSAREVIVRGKVEGRVSGRDKVALWSTGEVNGEVQTDRLAIEDGALLRGKVEAGRQPGKGSDLHTTAAAGATGGGAKQSSAIPSNTAAD